MLIYHSLSIVDYFRNNASHSFIQIIVKRNDYQRRESRSENRNAKHNDEFQTTATVTASNRAERSSHIAVSITNISSDHTKEPLKCHDYRPSRRRSFSTAVTEHLWIILLLLVIIGVIGVAYNIYGTSDSESKKRYQRDVSTQQVSISFVFIKTSACFSINRRLNHLRISTAQIPKKKMKSTIGHHRICKLDMIDNEQSQRVI